MIPLQGSRVRFLVRETRSCMPHSVARKKKTCQSLNGNKYYYWKRTVLFLSPFPHPSFFLSFLALSTHYTHAPHSLLPALHPICPHLGLQPHELPQVLDSAVVLPLLRPLHPAISVISPMSPGPWDSTWSGLIPHLYHLTWTQLAAKKDAQLSVHRAARTLCSATQRLLGAISYSCFNPARGCSYLLCGFLLMPGPVHQRMWLEL